MPATRGASGPTTVRAMSFSLAKRMRRGEIGGGEIDVFGIEGGAGVAWGDEDSAYAGALFDFPGEGVFAAAGADNQDVHGESSVSRDL